LHRYFFLLFTQNFILTSSQIMETAEAFRQREQFSYLDWVRSRNLGDPVGLNGFYAGWEDYCGMIHDRQGYQPAENYLIVRQDSFLQKEAEAIWVEDSKMQLYQDLSLADIFPTNADIGAMPVGSVALIVKYDGENVGGGSTIAASTAAVPPQVTFTPHQAEISGFVAGSNAIAVDFGLYALLMVDADAGVDVGNSGNKGTHQEYVHWVVLNIPQSNVQEGTAVVPYKGPAPIYGSGVHRYVFSLYKQKKAFTQQQVDSSRAYFAQRSGLRSYDWVRSHSAVLLNVPVGLEAFLCEWDESVGTGDPRGNVSRRGSEDVYSAILAVGSRSSNSSVVSIKRDDAEGGTESEQESMELPRGRLLPQSVAQQRQARVQAQAQARLSSPREPLSPRDQQPQRSPDRTQQPQRSPDRSFAREVRPATVSNGTSNLRTENSPAQVTLSERPASPVPVRTSFGSILMDTDHGLFPVREASPERFSGGKASSPVTTPDVHPSQLMHAGAEVEDLTRQQERKASHSVESAALPDADSMVITAEFVPSTPSPEAVRQQSVSSPEAARQQEAAGGPASQTSASSPERSPSRQKPQQSAPSSWDAPPDHTSPTKSAPPAYAEEESTPLSSPTKDAAGEDSSRSRSASKPRPSDDVAWLREQEERERREKKKLLQRQREAELERFEAARAQEEQRRRETAQAEERRRLEKQQEEDMDRLMDEKRRRAKADQEKIRKQEEMRRAMQEHELAEADRVRQSEARAELERLKALQEKAEEQRRLEVKQAEELRRALIRQQEEAAAESDRLRQTEERLAEEKRRQKQQRAEEEAQQLRQAEAQRLDQQRRMKLQQKAQQEEAELGQHGDEKGYSPSRQPQMGQQRSPQQLAPAIKLRTSFGNIVVDSNRGIVEAPPSSRYGGGRSDTSINDQHSSSDSNPDFPHSEFENESVLSALSSGTSVTSKLQRSVSFATVISTTSDDSYWIEAEEAGSSVDRERRDRRLRKERERENRRYMEQQMLESIESEEMRRIRMQELEEQRLRAEAAEAKARQMRLREEQQREVERLQQERAEAARQQQLREVQRQQEEATLEFLRREAEEEERRRLRDEEQARRLQEEHDFEAAQEEEDRLRRVEVRVGPLRPVTECLRMVCCDVL
jgi:hypothetical protein